MTHLEAIMVHSRLDKELSLLIEQFRTIAYCADELNLSTLGAEFRKEADGYTEIMLVLSRLFAEEFRSDATNGRPYDSAGILRKLGVHPSFVKSERVTL